MKKPGKGQRAYVICSCGSGFIVMGSQGRIVLIVVKKQRTERYLPGLGSVKVKLNNFSHLTVIFRTGVHPNYNRVKNSISTFYEPVNNIMLKTGITIAKAG